jgi:hypothetical protein
MEINLGNLVYNLEEPSLYNAENPRHLYIIFLHCYNLEEDGASNSLTFFWKFFTS